MCIRDSFSSAFTKKVRDEFVSNIWTYDEFKDYNLHIILSTTGTGKTTATSRHIQATHFFKVSRLERAHVINMWRALAPYTYHRIKIWTPLIYCRALPFMICINSLEVMSKLDGAELSRYALYIDEVSSFLEFTHNETLKRQMKYICISSLD